MSGLELRRRLLPILTSQAVGLACGIAGVRLTSSLVDPSDYGVYGIFTSLASVGVGVVYAGLIKFVSRHWQTTADQPGLLREVLAATRRKTPWLLVASAVAALLVAPGQKPVFGTLLFASAFLLALTQLAQSALQAGREHWRDFGISAGVSVARSFLPPLFYCTSGAGLVALLLGFLSQALLGALLGAWSLRRRWRGAEAGARTRILTPVYDGPQFVALAVAGWMLVGLNRWLVAWFFGSETAGYFTLAGNIGAILPSMLGMVMLQYFQPVWFMGGIDGQSARQRLLGEVDRVALVYTVLAIALAVSVHRIIPLLIGPLVGVRYASATGFVLVTGCSAASLTVGAFYHALLLAAKRERACLRVDLSGAAFLLAGGLASAAAGMEWFRGWLVFSPVIPWLVNRTLARRALFAPA